MKLSRGLRDRTKAFAANVIRLYVSLPKQREEVRVVGKQLFAREPLLRRRLVKRRGHGRMQNSGLSSVAFCRRPMSLNCG